MPCVCFSLKSDGNREFSFYRKPSADLLLSPDEIDQSWFQPGDIMQFCTVSLPNGTPVRDAHRRVIEIVKSKGGLIFFDPNLRFPALAGSGGVKGNLSRVYGIR